MNKKYIFLTAFASALLFSCGGSDANTELEKEKLKLEREKLELEKSKATQAEPQSEGKDESSKKEENNKEADEERRKEVAEKASRTSRFSESPDAVVVAKKTYFYSMPDDGAKKSSYLIEGDIINVQKIQRNFIYVTFTNEYSGKTTSGWLKADDLEPIGIGD
jgi:hypothetical protein